MEMRGKLIERIDRYLLTEDQDIEIVINKGGGTKRKEEVIKGKVTKKIKTDKGWTFRIKVSLAGLATLAKLAIDVGIDAADRKEKRERREGIKIIDKKHGIVEVPGEMVHELGKK